MRERLRGSRGRPEGRAGRKIKAARAEARRNPGTAADLIFTLILRGEAADIDDGRYDKLFTLALVLADGLDNLRIIGEAHTKTD